MRVGVRRVVLDLGPQALDVHVERLGVAEVVRAPDAVDEHVAGQHPAGVRQQQLEQLELLQRQRDELAADGHLVARGVEADVADLEHLGRCASARRRRDAAPQRGARTRATSSRRRNGLVT